MRILLMVALLLGVAACSNPPAADTPGNVESSTTTTTSTTSTTTSTQAPITTSAPPAAISFETLPGTPPDAFDSFAADMTTTMSLGDVAIDVTSEGTWVGDSFHCTVTSGLGGLAFSESIIATTDQMWIDTGSGFEPTHLFAPSAQEILSSCPASPLFWVSFQSEDMRGPIGEADTIAGRPATRFDIGGLAGGADLGAMTGFPGATVSELIVWFDTETEAIIAMVSDMRITEELANELGAGDIGAIGTVMDLTVSRINDPELQIDLP